MQICPDADPADGLLDVTIIHPRAGSSCCGYCPQMYSGRFVRDACVERVRAREICVDGPGWWGTATAN